MNNLNDVYNNCSGSPVVLDMTNPGAINNQLQSCDSKHQQVRRLGKLL